MAEKRFWNEEIETMPIEKLRKLQKERLQNAVEWAYTKTTFYRRLFDKAGIKPEDITNIEDVSKIPFTMDIEVDTDVPLKDRLAIPEDEIKMFHSTSGTVGAVVPIPFSKNETKFFFTEGEARGRWTMGVRPSDVVQVLTRFDCCFQGYRELGASLILMSAGRYNENHQIQLTKDGRVTVIEHMPSLLLSYFERMEQLGVKVQDTNLRLVSGVGEGWAESYKKKIEEKYGIPFMTLYGAVETCPCFASECEARSGMHISSEAGIIEVVDPETGEPLPEGEEGELVFTVLVREAMPLLRYKVGDVGRLLPYEPCSCGRTLPKMSYVKGRVSQLMKIGDKKILPIDVEEVIAKVEGLEGEFRIVMEKSEMEFLKLKLEHKPNVKDLKSLRERVEEAIFNEIRVKSQIELVPPGSLQRVTFKAQRVEKPA
ncbi:MAG: AMP-binding protein [Thermodesulfobacteriota bacterium]|nr:AMP-binding protein [Thermodesulfobacteriota bacterium]